jgi:predicted CDP-diglyceride synthetase/phosphatidate cytidylyltransferase
MGIILPGLLFSASIAFFIAWLIPSELSPSLVMGCLIAAIGFAIAGLLSIVIPRIMRDINQK